MERRCIRVLVPCYEPGGLSAKVYPHWEAKTFTIICLGKRKVYRAWVVRRGEGELLIRLIEREGVKAAFTLSLSTRALELLEKRGVAVLTGNFTTVGEAVSKWMRGELYVLKLLKLRQAGPGEIKPLASSTA
ncbi:MAG: hypothetical protein DRJ96_04535 [Thermoprotei archaeon]|nr:MAG: hypothetical protein DRJ67_06150 [Thermoprotei archaeon]RLE97197.1 MAG: hypothetical protein DRJ96_04535 [Thermoprotei archaeon]